MIPELFRLTYTQIMSNIRILSTFQQQYSNPEQTPSLFPTGANVLCYIYRRVGQQQYKQQ